jgi:hypothetical protein
VATSPESPPRLQEGDIPVANCSEFWRACLDTARLSRLLGWMARDCGRSHIGLISTVTQAGHCPADQLPAAPRQAQLRQNCCCTIAQGMPYNRSASDAVRGAPQHARPSVPCAGVAANMCDNTRWINRLATELSDAVRCGRQGPDSTRSRHCLRCCCETCAITLCVDLNCRLDSVYCLLAARTSSSCGCLA